MAGKNLTEQQRAFLNKYLKKGFFSRSEDKRKTESYEAYLLVENDFKAAMLALPGSDPRVQQLGGRAAGPMGKKQAGDFEGAASDLAPLIPDAQQLKRTIELEHAEAVRLFREAMDALPPDESRTQGIAGRAADPLGKTDVKDFPAAVTTLGTLTNEAKQLVTTLTSEHAEAARLFREAINALSGDESRTQGIAGRAADPLGKTDVKDFPAAVTTLGTLTNEAKQLVTTLTSEHAEAARLFREAMNALPADESRTQGIAGRAADPLGKTDVKDFPAAIVTLGKLTEEANQLARTFTVEHGQAVRLFHEAVNLLPADESRVLSITSRAAQPLGATVAKDVPAAIVTLGTLAVEANQLVTSLTSEHADAAREFREAMDALPADESRTQGIAGRAADPLGKTAVKDFPAATTTLGTLTEEAKQLVTTIVSEHQQAVLQFQTAVVDLPATDPRVQTIVSQAAAPLAKTVAKEMFAAIATLGALKLEADKAKIAIAGEKTKLLEDLALLTDPPTATPAEKKGMKTERDKATGAMSGDYPAPDDFTKARDAMKALTELIRISGRLTELAAKNPKAAAASRTAMEEFDTLTAAPEISSVALDTVKQEAEQAAANLELATTAYNDALALPEDTPQQQLLKEQEIQRTTEAWFEAERLSLEATQAEEDLKAKAKDRERGILGKQLLTEAVTWGPLSAGAGRPFPDDQAELFVAAYRKDPRLADSVVNTAKTARHPELLAANVDGLCDKVANGFSSSTGVGYIDEKFSREYAEKLAKMGGETGPQFFSNLDGYISSGGQFESDPLKDSGCGTFPELARARRAVAGAMLKSDGTIDPLTGEAGTALGHLLFNPDVLANSTPALNRNVLSSIDAFGDPTTLGNIQLTMNGVTAPTSGGGQALVRGSLGKDTTETVTVEDTRLAALSAFLMPMDQGPVGSCFSTAPARMVRELEPELAFEAYAELASKGQLTLATGDVVPAVTNIPPGEDPLVRGWEYTLATGAARNGNTWERNKLTGAMNAGIDTMQTLVDPTDWAKKKAGLSTAMQKAFIFTYNSTIEAKDANDGSSSQGRFVMVRKWDGKEVVTKQDFIDTVTGIALKSLKLKADSDKGKQVIDHVKTEAFINAVCPDKYKPWEMPSGGFENAIMTVMTGSNLVSRGFIGESPGTGAKPEGERTLDVLTGLLDTFDGTSPDLYVISTAGQHAFNVTPNHPTMNVLRDSDPTVQQEKMRKALIEPGERLRDTALPVEKVQRLFDAEIKREIAGQSVPELINLLEAAKAKRPTTALKPAELSTLLHDALQDYTKASAKTHADAWKLEEEKKGVVSDIAYEEKKTEIASELDTYFDNTRKGELVVELGAPEVVIADTNWGDSQTHTMFVIAPDPVTGEALLWKKTEPPGSLAPAGREWVDKQWQVVTV